MARPARTDYPGAWHHVMNRGSRRALVFEVDDRCHLFLSHLRQLPERFGVEVHAYALMPNHYHLLLRSVRGQLSRAMRHLGASYTQEVNRLNEWDGPVFKGRFRAQLVEDARYLVAVAAYIHLNPIKARLVRRLDQHCWTSHRAYVGLEPAPEWLSCDAVLGECGGAARFAKLVLDYRLQRVPWPEAIHADNGWLQVPTVKGKPWSHHQRSRMVTSQRTSTPEMVMARVLRVTGASASDLRRAECGQGANAARRFAVWALATGTDLTQREIGATVAMSPGHVANVLGVLRRTPGSLRPWIEAWMKHDM